MLKNKRILSVLLALSMVITLLAGFGATAGAVADDVTVSVAVYWDDLDPDEPMGITDVTIDKSSFTLNDAYWWEVPTSPDSFGPEVFNPAYNPTVLDASTKAFAWFTAENIGYWGEVEDADWGWDKYGNAGGPYVWRGVWVDGIWGVYEEMTDYDDSYWYGYAWILYIDGVESTLYSSNIELAEGMSIEWHYQYTSYPID
jgi:hypothetical protein